MNREYHTERLTLRILEPEEARGVALFYKENKMFLSKWEDIKPEAYYTEAHQRQVLVLEEKAWLRGDMVRFWIYEKHVGKGAIPIGTVTLNNILRGAFQSCFLGYKLAQSATRQGFMLEALNRVIDIAFNDLRLHRLEANIMPSNKPSLALVEKLGFHQEGLAKRLLKINGVWEDHYHMVLLNEALEREETK